MGRTADPGWFSVCRPLLPPPPRGLQSSQGGARRRPPLPAPHRRCPLRPSHRPRPSKPILSSFPIRNMDAHGSPELEGEIQDPPSTHFIPTKPTSQPSRLPEAGFGTGIQPHFYFLPVSPQPHPLEGLFFCCENMQSNKNLAQHFPVK